MRKRWVQLGALGLALTLLAVAAVAGVRWLQDRGRTDLAKAMELAPSAERYSFTDWAGVRAAVDPDSAAPASGDALSALLDDGYERDLTSASALVGSAELLRAEYGWSPLNLRWELFAQSGAGAVVLAAVPEDTSFADLADRLEGLGYTRPDSADGVWTGGAELVARLSGDAGVAASPVLQYVALDEDAGVVRTGDNAAHLESLTDGDPDGAPAALDQVVEASGSALSAAIYTGDHTCADLAMSQADPSDQASADTLLAEAGELSAVRAFAMAAQPSGEVVVAMSFEDDQEARTNADTRARLAAGPAPGQGGGFADRFELGDVTADGSLVTMDLAPVDGAFVLSDLSTGPVLFAAC